eukprot:m.271776 g.271776  ORF g.271776 m.271776 type:complete len:66 (+) comp54496_c0_seq1:106-303(+)
MAVLSLLFCRCVVGFVVVGGVAVAFVIMCHPFSGLVLLLLNLIHGLVSLFNRFSRGCIPLIGCQW